MKRLFSVLMMVLMMVSLFTTAHAELLNEGIQEGTIQVGEVEELRQANSETYRRADGTYECVVYAEDKYYKDDNGNYTEIDNSVVPAKHVNDKKEYAFANKANSEHFYFADKEPAILISSEECALAFQADAETDVKAAVGGLENREAISGYTLAGENYIAYGSAFKDTDLVYKVNNGLLKEYIVLYSPASPTKFTFTFDTANYSVKYTEDGLIGFYEADGKLRFELGELFAVDSVGSYTNELSYRIDLAKYGKTKITVSISDDFTKAPERVYPILIDPSVVISGSNKIQDAFVSSKYPNQNYYSDDYLRMGWSSSYKISRSYIRFELPQSIPGGVITESYMSLKKVDCGNAPSLKAYCVKKSWSSKTIKWNNKADYRPKSTSAEAEPKTNNWYRFYVTDIVKKWYNGTYPNYGFMVKNNSESGSGNWSTFYSSDVDLSYKPELRITYNPQLCYANVYIGKLDGDPEMPAIVSAVANEFNKNGYYGMSYSSYITKESLIKELKKKRVFSCITHGEKTKIRLTDNVFFTMDDLSAISSSDLANLSFVYLGACYTGEGGANAPNLVNKFYSKGVDCVLGFTIEVSQVETNHWTTVLMTDIANGLTIKNAMEDADHSTWDYMNYDEVEELEVRQRLIRGTTSFAPCP